MKKINIFNKTISPLSDGKGCPVERGGVWELPRRTPCATPSWKEGEHKVPSYRRMPVSSGFNRGGGIPLFSGMTKKICHKFPSREGWRVAPAGVWFAALVALFIATPSFAAPSELDKKTVASKAYVDTKQDIIDTGLVALNDPGYGIFIANVPSLVSYGTGTNNADGVLGNKIGIWGLGQTIRGFNEYDDWELYDPAYADLDNYVPTVRVMVNYIREISDTLNYKDGWWDPTTMTPAINGYIVTFDRTDTHENGNWPHLFNDKWVSGDTFVNSLALKQNKIAKSGYYYDTSGTLTAYGNDSNTNGWLNTGVKGTGLVTKTGTDGVVGERKIFESTDVANYHADGLTQNQKDIQDISIPTVGAIMELTDRLNWYNSNSYLDAIAKYTSTFRDANFTAPHWPIDDQYKLVDGKSLVEMMQTKQNRIMKVGKYLGDLGDGIPFTGNYSDTLDITDPRSYLNAKVKGSALVTKTSSNGLVGERKIFEATDVANYHATGLTQIQQDIQDISIPTVGAMMTAIANGANAALPTGTAGTVVTYNGVNATTGVQEFGERAVYDPANTYNASTDATKLATMASVKYECAGYEAGHENDPDYCWLWALPN